MHRAKAYEKDAPEGWKPTIGDRVYARDTLRAFAHQRGSGVVITEPNTSLVLVEISYRRRKKKYPFELKVLRSYRGKESQCQFSVG